MTIASSDDTTHVRWPPERFYWALLDASALPKHRFRTRTRRLQELVYLFEEVVPVPLEQLQVGIVAVHGVRSEFVLCGVEREVLNQQLSQDAVTLQPAALPQFLQQLDGQGVPNQLNTLRGDYLPRPIARLRRRWLGECLAAFIAMTGLIVLGLERRAGALHRQADALIAAQSPIYEQVLGPAMRQSVQPPALQLTAELRRLRQTRSAQVPETETIDLTGDLARLLEFWPQGDQVNALTQSISVSPGAIAIRAGLPDTEQSQRLVQAIGRLSNSDAASLSAVRGWSLQQPAVRAAKQGVDLEVRFAAVKQETSR